MSQTKPAEVKRRNGNPGRGKLPDTASQVTLEAWDPNAVPDAPDHLGEEGKLLWEQTVNSPARFWIGETDLAGFLHLCEITDEYYRLRERVFTYHNWRDRAALRALGKERIGLFHELGLTPIGRSVLGVAEVRIKEGVRRLSNGRMGTHEAEELEVKPDLAKLLDPPVDGPELDALEAEYNARKAASA